MSFTSYKGLKTPNEVLTKIAEYINGKGYTIVEPIADDLDIYSSASAVTDGKKFVFKDKTNTYFICMRSANGYGIFGTNSDAYMETLNSATYKNLAYSGIGVTVAEGYSHTQRWYNQYKAPLKKGATDILGVFMPVTNDGIQTDNNNKHNYSFTLYCNNITTPTDTLIFTVMKENDTKNIVSHIVIGNVSKYGTWTGGVYFSGSATRYTASGANAIYSGTETAILPVLSSGSISNTFLRIDIDEAPTDKRGNIYWASSGTDNITGKPLALPIRVGSSTNGQIPNYKYMQSASSLDWGRNVNTLNCITINMPIYMAVRVDPDTLDNYAAVGYASGVSFVSMLNMQTAGTYEISYPTSGDLCQVFPMSRRRGQYGFDGISIRQEV